MATATLVSRAEYDARTAAGERLEFDDGVILETPNNDSLHDTLKARLSRQLTNQVPEPALVCAEMTFEITRSRLRIPDLAVVSRPPAAVAGTRFQGAPDLVVEIASESDSAVGLLDRVDLYLAYGATAVWVVWPTRRLIDIHQSQAPTRHYGPGDTLAGEEPVPQFRLDVGALLPPVADTLD